MESKMEYNIFTGEYMPVRLDKDKVKKSDQPLWPSLSVDDDEGDDDENDDSNDGESFEKDVPIFIEKADEHIVCGVVYSPDEVDAQGDSASAEEIKKAAYYFMEKTRQFKVMHKGKSTKTEILESYLAPQALTIGDRKIKKGTWLITVRVNDPRVWKKIKNGTLTGFSMAGYAKAG